MPSVGVMWRVHIQNHPRVGAWYSQVQRKPGWVTGAALLAATLVIVVPLLLLVIAALFVGVIVFVLLSAVTWFVTAVRGVWRGVVPGANNGGRPAQQGRRNVRVVYRDGGG